MLFSKKNFIKIFFLIYFCKPLLANNLTTIISQLEKLACFKTVSINIADGGTVDSNIREYLIKYGISGTTTLLNLNIEGDVFQTSQHGQIDFFRELEIENFSYINFTTYRLPFQVAVIQFSSDSDDE